jgi:ribosome biogenesis GTPase
VTDLSDIGLSDRWRALLAEHVEAGLVPGRVIRSGRGSSLVLTGSGVLRAKPAAHLVKTAEGPLGLPAVGDWVALDVPDAIDVPLIEAVLERTSVITRGDANRASGIQVLAANVDVVFIVHPIDDDPNVRRIERELALAWDSGAQPVVVLSKADLSAGAAEARETVEAIALGVDIITIDSLTGEGVEAVRTLLGDRTAVLLGPSGAGKSTLANALLGDERQATAEVRVNDGRGRHTTVTRELFAIPGGGVLIDTPGLRAIGMTGSEEGIASAFSDVEELAAACRFRDCTHVDEPGCAVLAAVAAGELAPDRLESYRKLMAEAQAVAAKADARVRAESQGKRKAVSKAVKEYNKRYRSRP